MMSRFEHYERATQLLEEAAADGLSTYSFYQVAAAHVHAELANYTGPQSRLSKSDAAQELIDRGIITVSPA